VSRYFLGVTFSPKDLYGALQTASNRGIGSRIQDLILLCFHYRPVTGKFAAAIMLTVRALGIATLLGLVWLIVRGTRAPAPRKVHPAAPNAPDSTLASGTHAHGSGITDQST